MYISLSLGLVLLRVSLQKAKGKPKASQRQATGKPWASQRQAKGKPKASQRQAKGKPKGRQRQAKSSSKCHQNVFQMSSKRSSKLLRPDSSKLLTFGLLLDPILDQVLIRNGRWALKCVSLRPLPGNPPRKVLLYAQAWSMRMSIN